MRLFRFSLVGWEIEGDLGLDLRGNEYVYEVGMERVIWY